MKDNVFYRSILDSIEEGIYFVDTQRRITFWNKGAEKITGFSSDEVVNKFCYNNILNHVNSDGKKLCMNGCPLHASLSTGEEKNGSVFLHHKLGHRVPVKVHVNVIKDGETIVGAVETFVRESDEFVNDYQLQELKSLAYQDQLTEIPNRRFLESQLESHIIKVSRSKLTIGVAFIDIDFFKKVNDTYGHNVGDEVLKMLSKTMKSATRNTDIIGRWGGEEFLVIYNHVTHDIMKIVCEKLRMLVESSGLRIEDKEIKITISVGATLINQEDTIEAIVQRADECLYKSKATGRNKVTLWEPLG
jgi:diguanylate cyclase (GGDEF)-like protein/PAS domain S-box-containing protein